MKTTMMTLTMMVFFQRVQYSEMSINQCQTGVDDLPDIPPELFDTGRSKLGHKGWMFVSFMHVGCSSFHCNMLDDVHSFMACFILMYVRCPLLRGMFHFDVC